MRNTFVCPHCHGVLNPNVKITLVAAVKRGKGMILLSPQPGNYRYICDKSLEDALKPGDKVTFSCPICTADLTSAGNPKFCQLELHTAGQEPRRVEFSRVYGTHATFVIGDNSVTSYGEDADEFGSTNFFGS